MPTKVELEKLNKKLKADLKEATAKLKEALSMKEKSDEGLTEPAISVIKQGDIYQLVELRFNPETREAKVIDIRDASKNNKDYSLAEFFGNKFFIEEIMNRF